jgi:ubiquinone/menaquinone biosynthesis C-methylase UbiE
MRFSTIAHHDHVYCNPISPEKMDRVLGLVDLREGARVLDVGCGKGELLVRAAELYGAAGVGVDTNPEFLREARARAATRVPGRTIEFHEMEFESFRANDGTFDLATCIGSTHACGGYRTALELLKRAVRPGGHVLAGEGYWKRDPSASYLEGLRARRDELTDHFGNVRAGIEAGLTPMYAAASNADEWDHYEGLYARAVERFLNEHPEDPDRDAMALRIRDWRRLYLESGRETLGFGLYLFTRGAR